jgi:hypothetical protein
MYLGALAAIWKQKLAADLASKEATSTNKVAKH